MQRIHLLSAVAILTLAGLAGVWFGRPSSEPPPVAVQRGPMDTVGGAADEITVHVSGAVAAPGLVTLEPGARIAHAIAAAGGALPGANLTSLNLASGVHDGDQVVVPMVGDSASGSTPGTVGDGLVDLNRASAGELEALPGVGPVLAGRIFDYREDHGPFAAVEDLLDVPGIGEGKLAALREAIVVR